MSWTDDREFLRRLRDLPPPPTPPGLEARLLAGIPAGRAVGPAARKPRLRRWTIAAGSALAAGVVLTLVLIRSPHEPDSRRETMATPRDIEPTFVQQTSSPNYKETRPCNILPPLPPRSL
jgi:hypothetical protein